MSINNLEYYHPMRVGHMLQLNYEFSGIIDSTKIVSCDRLIYRPIINSPSINGVLKLNY